MRERLSNLEGTYFRLSDDLLVLNSLSDDYFGMNDVAVHEEDKMIKLAWEYRQNQSTLNLALSDIRNQIKIFEDNLYGLYEDMKNKGE